MTLSMKKATAIVVGYKGTNSTGLIRSLGQAGFRVVFASSYSRIASKYVSDYLYLPTEEQERLRVLIDYMKKLPQKAALFTGDDNNTTLFDRNYDLLSPYCYCPNARGKLLEIADKTVMGAMAKEAGLNVPETDMLDLTTCVDSPIDFPVILKPYAGYAGKKVDIQICRSKEDFANSTNYLRGAGYTKVMVQQFLESKNMQDICMMGFALEDGTVKIPCMIRKIRSYPLKQGSLSYGRVENELPGVDRTRLKDFVKKTGYVGIFDIDIMICDGTAYFIEINYRNGQNGYVPTAAGYNIPANWFMGMQGRDVDAENPLEPLYYMDEHSDYKHVFEGNITFKEWLRQLRTASVFAMYCSSDMNPFIRQYIRIPESWKQKFLH